MEVFVQVLLTVLFVGVAVAFIFWSQIVTWAYNTLFPWIKKYLPELEKPTRYAFVKLDEVIIPARNIKKAWENLTNIKKAWEKLREHLLKVLVQFDLNARNKWVKRITYWAIRYLESKQATPAFTEEIVNSDSLPIRTPESNKPEVVRVVAEEIVDIDSLPPDVRKEWLKRDKIAHDVDVTQLRERELRERERELTMTY